MTYTCLTCVDRCDAEEIKESFASFFFFVVKAAGYSDYIRCVHTEPSRESETGLSSHQLEADPPCQLALMLLRKGALSPLLAHFCASFAHFEQVS